LKVGPQESQNLFQNQQNLVQKFSKVSLVSEKYTTFAQFLEDTGFTAKTKKAKKSHVTG